MPRGAPVWLCRGTEICHTLHFVVRLSIASTNQVQADAQVSGRAYRPSPKSVLDPFFHARGATSHIVHGRIACGASGLCVASVTTPRVMICVPHNHIIHRPM